MQSELRSFTIVASLIGLLLVVWALESAGGLARVARLGSVPAGHGADGVPPVATLELGSVTTDVHDHRGRVYKLDVAVTAELASGLSYDERRALVAVGRQAVLDAIRQVSYSGLDPEHFQKARDAIESRLTSDLGPDRVARVLLTGTTFYPGEARGPVETFRPMNLPPRRHIAGGRTTRVRLGRPDLRESERRR